MTSYRGAALAIIAGILALMLAAWLTVPPPAPDHSATYEVVQ